MSSDTFPKELRVALSRPFGAEWLDKVQMWMPSTWFGMAQFLGINFLSIWTKSILSLLLPALCYGSIQLVARAHHVDSLPPAKMLMLPYIISPWTWGVMDHALSPLHQVYVDLFQMRRMRSITDKNTLEFLASLVEQHKTIRKRRYDLYLPASPNHQAILFLPGATVPHEAYASPASLLTEYGYLVAVLSAEPLRRPHPSLGFHARYLRKIQQEIQLQHQDIQQWILMGHSMGAFCASMVAEDLEVKHLVLWGVTSGFADSLSNLAQTRMRVLSVKASNDRMECLYGSDEKRLDLANRLPPDARIVTIQGGTHAGFGSYTIPSIDPEKGIPNKEQHKQAVKITHGFLSS